MSSASEIRRSFLRYFERHGHRVVPSSPLVPHDDPTLLFTNAGMNQFKEVFLGRETRDYRRAATAQKCMRVSGKHNDLENVGPSPSHHTFFEMLGNFSFGDYFKQEAIPLAWELLTREWTLPQDRLWATVFRGEGTVPRDTEAYEIWTKFLPSERVGELGASDNFWQMGDTGPCGRCSEIYYFRGDDIECSEEAAGHRCRGLECSCGRYIEIWNNVFMEFDRQADGTLRPLPAPSIDTGMGLERVTAVLQGHLSNYDTDLFAPIIRDIVGITTRHTYGGGMSGSDISIRVIADHIRAITFLIADGVRPSNEWRGYVLRKIMRRAMRHGKRLDIDHPFLHLLVDRVVNEMGHAYPDLRTNRTQIIDEVTREEQRFDRVLTDSLPRLEELLKRASEFGVFPGDEAFRLYDTFGLPLEFIEDLVQERRLRFDREGFERAMATQRQKARAKSKFKTDDSPTAWYVPEREEIAVLRDAFEGYQSTVIADIPIALLYDDRPVIVPVLREGQTGYVVLPRTPFYIESGGQVSDSGRITGPHGEAQVDGLIRIPVRSDFPRAHRIRVTKGEIRATDHVTAEVDVETRNATRRNHTATHLLHAALREVLGPHVKQAGSLVAPDRLRFDFVHVGAVSPAQIVEIERIVNAYIVQNIPIRTEVRNTEEAIAAGAMALFGEKYGDRVRVVSIPGFSVELCGGTHVAATGDIGLFAVISEGGIAAGVRRIEAVTGLDSLAVFQRNRDELSHLAVAVNARPGELIAKMTSLQEENKRLARDLQRERMRAALGGSATGTTDDAIQIDGVTLIAREVSGLDKEGLRALVDQHRSRIKTGGVIILASPADGKVVVVVGVTPDLTQRIPAGQIVKQIAPIIGGGGGGRADFAEAGGKDPSKIPELLAASRDVIQKLLSA